MTMTTMPESLNSPVSGKAVFMEFGPPGQQMPPSPMSHGHYSMHCLHAAGHSQPDAASYSPASSFSRPLAYPYVGSVGSHSGNPYMSSVQSYPNSTSLAQTRLEETAGDVEGRWIVDHRSPKPALNSRAVKGVQVKIWFQNKRSKFKKLMKQGGAALESGALANGRSLSAGSPPGPPVWNTNSSSAKSSTGTPGTYIPSYTSWYPTAHQETMQQPQLM
ncbi:PREDICTED: homeobox protein DLX-1 [Gekko japonicus]|uniref:Homeobox protein DLX-1 n=1 Tax=Gekko japonicus TaxID=146911 RepID=A0ABM1JMQ7_GEKJA|nr:PREDICTED: homeobox protein DLX-1 [Gekko japonicus]